MYLGRPDKEICKACNGCEDGIKPKDYLCIEGWEKDPYLLCYWNNYKLGEAEPFNLSLAVKLTGRMKVERCREVMKIFIKRALKTIP